LHRALFPVVPLIFVLLVHGMGLCVAADNEASAAASPAAGAVQPALALLLPLASPDFARAAESLQLGFMAARERGGEKLAVGVFATDASAESILSAYANAVKLGARLVIGPMTRSGVSALAASKLVSVPTLGLNLPADKTALPSRFYTFGLALEAEAQLVAQTAFAEHFRSAILVSAKSALAQRSRDAFAETWKRLGGSIKASYEFAPETSLPALRETLSTAAVDMIFLAADTEQARAVRPFLNNVIEVFATSQINAQRSDAIANVDLNGIRFVEMPWLVQPDHPAVMAYARPEGIGADMERFYALGIDAFRVAAALLEAPRKLSLDGVTGRLSLEASQVAREPVQAVFRNGIGVALDHDDPGEGKR
jgi:outer membrane PBP1 activator LpoA protein